MTSQNFDNNEVSANHRPASNLFRFGIGQSKHLENNSAFSTPGTRIDGRLFLQIHRISRLILDKLRPPCPVNLQIYVVFMLKCIFTLFLRGFVCKFIEDFVKSFAIFQSFIMSNDVAWAVTRNSSRFLLKKRNCPKPFSTDPMNLTNLHSQRYSGICNSKAVGVMPAKAGFQVRNVLISV